MWYKERVKCTYGSEPNLSIILIFYILLLCQLIRVYKLERCGNSVIPMVPDDQYTHPAIQDVPYQWNILT